jgi:TRAP-type C4-dicarboxylate transport system permease small subunit
MTFNLRVAIRLFPNRIMRQLMFTSLLSSSGFFTGAYIGAYKGAKEFFSHKESTLVQQYRKLYYFLSVSISLIFAEFFQISNSVMVKFPGF